MKETGRIIEKPDPWGPLVLEESVVYRWRIGPLTMWAVKYPHEIRLSRKQSRDPAEDLIEGPVETGEPLPEDEQTTRFAAGVMDRRLILEPMLADRNVVVRPEIPFTLVSGGTVALYVTTPLWVRISTRKHNLAEIPTFRPSDTWFGPSSIEGELCYASRTHARMNLHKVEMNPARVPTVVHLKNLTDEPMEMDKVNLPIPHLSLYRTKDGMFWSQSVSATWGKDEERAVVQLMTGPPAEAENAEPFAGPRATDIPNIMVRAVMKLLMR